MVANKEKKRVQDVIDVLEKVYPFRTLQVKKRSPLKILIATILSAQSTDQQVDRVITPLFEKYSTAEAFAKANSAELQGLIYTVGYYRQKAKHIQRACHMILDEFNAKVPRTMEELLRLPGVGRKTANIVLNRAFGVVEGIAVDTHVFRIAHRLGFSDGSTPEKVERDLMSLLPFDKWNQINRLLINHGRNFCKARNPQCEICPISHICPFLNGRLKSEE